MATPKKRKARKIERYRLYNKILDHRKNVQERLKEQKRIIESRFMPAYERPRAEKDFGPGVKLVAINYEVGEDEPIVVSHEHLKELNVIVSDNLEEIKDENAEQKKEEILKRPARKKPTRRRKPASDKE